MATSPETQAQIELLNKQQQGLAKESELYKAIDAAKQALLDKDKQSLDYQQIRTRELQRELELLNKKETIEEASQKSKQAELSLRKNQLEIERSLLDLRKFAKDIEEAEEELAQAKDKSDQKQIDAAKIKLELAKENYNTVNKYVERKKELDALEKTGVDNAVSGLNLLGIRTEEQDTSMTKMFRGLMRGGEDAESVLTGMGNGLKKLNVENVAISLLSKTVESTIMMVKMADTTFATFNKTIGTTGELNNEIYELSAGNAQLGFTLQETAQSYTALAGGFVDFRGLSQQNRIELAQTVTELQAIGIGSEIATKNISFFSKAMGLSTEQSISLSKELVAVAGALEMAPSKIASDFASAASSIVVYGNRGIEVFKGLEAASKASGVEISNLISIASKMDTFQGAAEAAGKLNAVLGGGLLNSSQLLMASEEERIRLVIESVQSQGVQFNDLDKYTQKAIANAAGITDMAEANKLFGMSVGAYDDYIAKTALSSEEQAKLEERVQASKSAQEKLNYIMQSFAVLVMPILNAVTALMNAFMDLNGALGGTLPLILTIGASLYAFPALLNPYVLGIMAVLGLVYLLYQALYNGENSVTRFLDKFIILKIAFYSIMSPIIFAIESIKSIYYWIVILVKVIGWLVNMLVNFEIGGLSLKKAFIGIGDALRPITEFIGKLYELNTGFMEILSNANSFGEFWSSYSKYLEKLSAILHIKNSPALYEMADYMAAGFKNFANVITSLAIPALNMFLAPLRIVGSIMSSVWSGISTIVGATSSLFGKDNVVGIKANFDATEALATTAAKITPDSMTNVKQLAAEVQKFNMELKTMTTIAASEPLEKLAKAINATNQQITNQVGKIMLEGREVGKFVLDTINKKGNIDTAVKSTSTIT